MMNYRGGYTRRNDLGHRRFVKHSSMPDSPKRTISDFIVRLGDSSVDQVPGFLLELSGTLFENKGLMIDCIPILFSCVLSQPHKITIYATFVGLLFSNDSGFGREFIKQLVKEFQDSLIKCELYNLKLTLRFIVELANSNVISISVLSSLYQTFSENAFSDLPQYLSDYYASILMGSIVCLHQSFVEVEFLEKVEAYMGQRRQIFLHCFNKPRDLDAEYRTEFRVHDYGLSEVDWLQDQYLKFLDFRDNCQSKGISVLPRPFLYPEIDKSLKKIEHLPSLNFDIDWFGEYSPESLIRTIPASEYLGYKESAESALRDEKFFDLFFFTCPRPRFSIFTPFESSLSGMDEWMLEDLILDIMHFFRYSPEIVHNQFIMFGSIPNFNHVLVNTIFKDMFNVFSIYPLAHYDSLIFHLCRQANSHFLLALVESVERFFGCIRDIRAPARNLLINWFAFHLNSTDLKWNWDIWEKSIEIDRKAAEATDEPPYKLIFVKEVLAKCISYSFYENVKQCVNSEQLLSSRVPETNNVTPSNSILKKLMESINSHDPKSVVEEMINMAISSGSDVLKVEELIHTVTCAILIDGTNSMSHLQALLVRYLDVLLKLKQESSKFEKIVLDSIHEFYEQIPQRSLITVLKFYQNQILDVKSLIEYFFEEKTIEHYPLVLFWELIERLFGLCVDQSKAIRNEINYLIEDNPNTPLEDIPKYQEKLAKKQIYDADTTTIVLTMFRQFSKIELNKPNIGYKTNLVSEFCPYIAIKCCNTLTSLLSEIKALAQNNTSLSESMDLVQFLISNY